MMIRLSAAVVAMSMMLAGAASAATLSMRPSSVLFEGLASYEIDTTNGFAGAEGVTDDLAYDLFISGFFDPALGLESLEEVGLALFPAGNALTALDAIGPEDIEVGTDFVALLLGDLQGDLAAQFTGGKLLAVFTATDTEGVATFELRRLDDPAVIPLPATGLLLVGGIAALGLARRKRG